MPIYEFRCKKCGHVFEVLFRSSTAEEDTSCPVCGNRKTAKLMSAFAGKKSGGGCGSCSSGNCSSCGH